MHGLDLLQQTFERAKAEKRAAFMPYFPIGYPDLPTSVDVLQMLAEAGADALEIGVPFSDPLADGPTIQAATQIALAQGASVAKALEAVAELRQRGVTIPCMLMSYINPLLAYGLEDLTTKALEVGVSGFITPDLPADEADDLQALTEAHGLGYAHFLAPTSSAERLKLAAEKARGFIYLVSVTGVTGARQDVPTDLQAFILRVRKVARQPLVVGFGIASPEKAAEVGQIADGVIVGSKLITLMQEEGKSALEKFAKAVRSALD